MACAFITQVFVIKSEYLESHVSITSMGIAYCEI